MSQVSEAAKTLLVTSLSDQAARMRQKERACRVAYRQPGPLRDAAQRLADVYASAAELFERSLGELEFVPFGQVIGVDLATGPAQPEVRTFGPCHPECMAAGMKLAFLHEPVPDRPVGTTASGGVVHRVHPATHLIAEPPEFPEGCKPTAKCASGRLVYCKNCGGPTARNYDQPDGNFESFNCADCRATTYVEIPV